MTRHTGTASLRWVALALLLCCCSGEQKSPGRTMQQARDVVVELYGQMDGFKLEKQLSASLAGLPALRMEATWNYEGQPRRGIIYLIERPFWYNVICYSAPVENSLFELGYPVFQDVLRKLEPSRWVGKLTVEKKDGYNVMRNPDLQLTITYPEQWEYTLDETNRALVLSGPRRQPSWLTTIAFSLVKKWPDQ